MLSNLKSSFPGFDYRIAGSSKNDLTAWMFRHQRCSSWQPHMFVCVSKHWIGKHECIVIKLLPLWTTTFQYFSTNSHKDCQNKHFTSQSTCESNALHWINSVSVSDVMTSSDEPPTKIQPKQGLVQYTFQGCVLQTQNDNNPPLNNLHENTIVLFFCCFFFFFFISRKSRNHWILIHILFIKQFGNKMIGFILFKVTVWNIFIFAKLICTTWDGPKDSNNNCFCDIFRCCFWNCSALFRKKLSSLSFYKHHFTAFKLNLRN